MMRRKKITLAGVLALLVSVGLSVGCSSIDTMMYSPITATLGRPHFPYIEIEPHRDPAFALLITAKQPVGEGDSQWVNIDLPMPRGAAVGKVTGVEVCYKIEALQPGSTYISQTRLTEMTTPDEAPILMDDDTNRTALEPTCYVVNTSVSPKGSVSLSLKVVFGGTDDRILLGGIALKFSRWTNVAVDYVESPD